jgi:hypothetical protein
MSDDGATRYLRSTSVIPRRVAGETLLVPLAGRSLDPTHRSAELFVLNATGERMWEWLAEPKSVPDLARNLIAEYEVSAEVAETDAAAFVKSMREVGAIDIV